MAPVASTLQNAGLWLLSRPQYFTRAIILYRQAKDKTASAKPAAASAEAKAKAGKVAVDGVFFARLWKLLKIVIPGPLSPEFWLLILHSGFLVARTWLSVVVANLDGRLVKNLVDRDGKGFSWGLALWFGIAIPATFTNSMIKFLQSRLALNFRNRLTKHVHRMYLEAKTYYKVVNLDSRIENADQLITSDVAKFCDALAELYGNIGKPALDMYLFSNQLERNLGDRGMGSLWWAYYFTLAVMRAITPNFGKLRETEAKLEGEFRFAHSRLITNAEEIAFYGGHEIERNILDQRYNNLARHANKIYQTRVWFNMFEDMLLKYAWSTIGLIAQAVPVFWPDAVLLMDATRTMRESDNVAKRTEKYITNRRLMTSLGDAGSRMMYSYKDLAELAGYTARMAEMLTVFGDMKAANYEKVMVSSDVSLKKIEGKIVSTSLATAALEDANAIIFTRVPLYSPNGDLLVRDLTFRVSPGQHLMVTGPNGSGKSSLVRLLSELWPAFRGTLAKPTGERDLFFVPQRPYLCIGTLRDQVIYPDTVADMKKKGRTDDDLMRYLTASHLTYIPAREGGWDTVKEWKDVFSGGEKQRIGMARIFYHKPRFAVLDECTSAVSVDVEGLMYAHAKDVGISLITVSHRPSLFKYHQFLLRLDGNNGWSFEELNQEKELLSITGEIQALTAKLAEVPRVQARLADVNRQLKL